jgi:hypothetical protein
MGTTSGRAIPAGVAPPDVFRRRRCCALRWDRPLDASQFGQLLASDEYDEYSERRGRLVPRERDSTLIDTKEGSDPGQRLVGMSWSLR